VTKNCSLSVIDTANSAIIGPTMQDGDRAKSIVDGFRFESNGFQQTEIVDGHLGTERMMSDFIPPVLEFRMFECVEKLLLSNQKTMVSNSTTEVATVRCSVFRHFNLTRREVRGISKSNSHPSVKFQLPF
jgi:hypothetical protein